jgi:hypothetical protein
MKGGALNPYLYGSDLSLMDRQSHSHHGEALRLGIGLRFRAKPAILGLFFLSW